MNRFLTKPWLRVYSGISQNIAAAFLVIPFVGYAVNLPKSLIEVFFLIFDILLSIMFLLASVWCEKRLEKRR